MKEITDERLSELRASLSVCNPLVQSLVMRLDRVEGELASASVPRLAKYQPCGCVICTCDDDEQCHGCGATNCDTHPVAEFTNPLYESHPLVAENTTLREKVKRMEKAANATVRVHAYISDNGTGGVRASKSVYISPFRNRPELFGQSGVLTFTPRAALEEGE